MRPEAFENAVTDYRDRLQSLRDGIGPVGSPHDLHDRLYWQVRLPRLLTGPKALWRRYLDECSPMLAAPMLQLGARLPIEQRVHKRFFRESITRMAPDLGTIPYATDSGRVKWRRIMQTPGRFQKYMVETLLDPLPVFDEWFDRRSIEAMLRGATSHRGRLVEMPDGLMSRIYRRIAGRVIGAAIPAPMIINLLTLKLWLGQSLGQTGCRKLG
jgi:hypothetical protein